MKNYKVNYDIGVRPLVKYDVFDLEFEINDVEELEAYNYSNDWCDDTEIYSLINITTLKSKLLKSMFKIND